MKISAGTSATMFEPRRECSMPPDDKARIRHLVEAASKAVSYAAGGLPTGETAGFREPVPTRSCVN
jgi:hypothetical protein